MRYFVRLAGIEHTVEVVDGATGTVVRDAQGVRTASISGAHGAYRVVLDGRVVDLTLVGSEPGRGGQRAGSHSLDVFGLGTAHTLDICSERDRPQSASSHDARATRRAITTQMPGRVVQVRVRAGDRVSKGQPLLVVEAMKMENELYADEELQVVSIAVQAGDAVDMGATLLVVE